RDDPEVRRLAGGLLSYGAATHASLRYPFLPWYVSEARLGKLRYAFERLAALSRRNGFEVVVLLVPFLDDEGRPTAYHAAFDLVRHEAERVGFTTLDPTDDFRVRGFERFMLEHDGKLDVVHPNVEGHAILAQRLYTALEPVLARRR